MKRYACLFLFLIIQGFVQGSSNEELIELDLKMIQSLHSLIHEKYGIPKYNADTPDYIRDVIEEEKIDENYWDYRVLARCLDGTFSSIIRENDGILLLQKLYFLMENSRNKEIKNHAQKRILDIQNKFGTVFLMEFDILNAAISHNRSSSLLKNIIDETDAIVKNIQEDATIVLNNPQFTIPTPYKDFLMKSKELELFNKKLKSCYKKRKGVTVLMSHKKKDSDDQNCMQLISLFKAIEPRFKDKYSKMHVNGIINDLSNRWLE